MIEHAILHGGFHDGRYVALRYLGRRVDTPEGRYEWWTVEYDPTTEERVFHYRFAERTA